MAQKGLSEIEIVQNVALGATMIWRFGISFQEESGNIAPPFLLAFLILPITLHKETLDQVLSTQPRSGLSLFAQKIGQRREDLLAIHLRAFALRELTLQSIGTGVRSKLFTVNYQIAQLRSNTHKIPKTPERIKPHLKGAIRLGVWFARMPLDQTVSLLKVDF